MAQYGGEQYGHKEGLGHHTIVEEHAHNPLHSTAVDGQDNIGGTKVNTIGTGAGHVHEQGIHNGAGTGAGGILHRSGSGSSSSSEDDGEGGRRKKKGVVQKIKDNLPATGSDHHDHNTSTTTTVGGGGVGYVGSEEAGHDHETKGLMDKIKEKLPGGGHQ